MTYPLSTEVTAGQPTAADQYNNLRKDALTLGNEAADSLNMSQFLNRHFEFLDIQYLATNRLRVPYSNAQPPTLMINGYLLQAAANVDLPANQFSGPAATWYIFAVRSAGSTTFTLMVNTSAAEATDQRLIGECTWNGSSVTVVKCYFTPIVVIPVADYDSGWFAVTGGTLYTKAHAMGQVPRMVFLYWCNVANGAGDTYLVTVVNTTSPSTNTVSPMYFDGTNINIKTGAGSGNSTLMAVTVQSASGYYRVLAWK